MATMWKAEIELADGRKFSKSVLTYEDCSVYALELIYSKRPDCVVVRLSDLITVDLDSAARTLNCSGLHWDSNNGGFYGFGETGRQFVAMSLNHLATLAPESVC